MADNANHWGLEKTVMDLMESRQSSGFNETNMLLMLSLVNLMGIVNILQQSAGTGGLAGGTTAQQVSRPGGQDQGDLMRLLNQAATGQLDPMQLLALLNSTGKGNAALMNLLAQMMPPPPPPPKPQANQSTNGVLPPKEKLTATTETEGKPEPEPEPERSNQKKLLKWDPRLG